MKIITIVLLEIFFYYCYSIFLNFSTNHDRLRQADELDDLKPDPSILSQGAAVPSVVKCEFDKSKNSNYTLVTRTGWCFFGIIFQVPFVIQQDNKPFS